jgi:hypothetical protein
MSLHMHECRKHNPYTKLTTKLKSKKKTRQGLSFVCEFWFQSFISFTNIAQYIQIFGDFWILKDFNRLIMDFIEIFRDF